ncbi:MAG: hypothetical protein P8Y53_14260, partial [Pseudolabrys sp.]
RPSPSMPFAAILCAGLALWGPACKDELDVDPCFGVTCSGHGSCALQDGQAACACEDGYLANGLACEPDATGPCAGVDCSGHGACREQAGAATCDCCGTRWPTRPAGQQQESNPWLVSRV